MAYRGLIGNYQRKYNLNQDPTLGTYATLPGHSLAPWQNTPQTLYDPLPGYSQQWGQPGSATYGAYQAGNEGRLAAQGQGLGRLAQLYNISHAPYARNPTTGIAPQVPQAVTPTPNFAPDVKQANSAIAAWQAAGTPTTFSGQVNPNAMANPGGLSNLSLNPTGGPMDWKAFSRKQLMAGIPTLPMYNKPT